MPIHAIPPSVNQKFRKYCLYNLLNGEGVVEMKGCMGGSTDGGRYEMMYDRPIIVLEMPPARACDILSQFRLGSS